MAADEQGATEPAEADPAPEPRRSGPQPDEATPRGEESAPQQDEGPNAPSGDAPQEDGPDRVTQLETELADMRDRLARARADYSNLQKRIERDAALERERVKARVLEGFLQVYEYGQMAAFEAERNPGPLADGVKMVVREFDRLLQNEGVQPIGTPGESYDRTAHEACATEAAEGVEPGHVSRVISQGYRLGDRVLRYAKVAVAPADGDQTTDAA